MIILRVLLGILLFLVWFSIDFVLGRKINKKEHRPLYYPHREGMVDWIDNGADFFQSFQQDLKSAEHHIHVMFYIFRNDSIGSQIIQTLCDKAEQGLDVRVLVDRLGAGMDKKGRAALQKAGVRFHYSCRPGLPFYFFTLNQRNHRKISIIDGRIGYLGGFNVGDEYIGRDPKFGFWRDFHLRFQGDGVQDLQAQFFSDWSKAEALPVKESEGYFPELNKAEQRFRFVAVDGSGLEGMFHKVISNAEHFVYIGSPYFIPGRRLQEALLKAAERGVDVRILLPEKQDHPLVKEASYSYLRELIQAGAKIYHFQDGFFHAKALLIDNDICDIGTANFDQRSFHLNSEMNALVFSPEIIEKVKSVLERDMDHSTLLTESDVNRLPVKTRLTQLAAKRIERFL
ncbi:cardiolipin synthase [Alteribacillus sp. HJP-4]|uniref:cardiolipin synthase n=1 Tax=Alteribacillus sp. HJP-4 TaxID=2775394 RepID=UPI0035CCF866